MWGVFASWPIGGRCKHSQLPYRCVQTKISFPFCSPSSCLHPHIDKFSSSNNKRQKLVQDFLSSIDQTGEFLALMDEDDMDDVKQERLEVGARPVIGRGI